MTLNDFHDCASAIHATNRTQFQLVFLVAASPDGFRIWRWVRCVKAPFRHSDDKMKVFKDWKAGADQAGEKIDNSPIVITAKPSLDATMSHIETEVARIQAASHIDMDVDISYIQ